jgi:hypothetical protein
MITVATRRVLLLFLGVITLYGYEGLLVTDTRSLLAPTFTRSEILGLIAGFGTTFAALPDLISMVRRRSSTGMNPMMAPSWVPSRSCGSGTDCSSGRDPWCSGT